MIRKAIAILASASAVALSLVACDDEDAVAHCKAVCVASAGCNTQPYGCEARCDAAHVLITDASCDGHANTLYECYEYTGVCTPDLDARCAAERQALSDCESAYCQAHAGAKGCP